MHGPSISDEHINFLYTDAVPLHEAYFGQGTGDIFLDELVCEGTEMTLRECRSDSSHNCNHEEDAGVRCQSKLWACLGCGTTWLVISDLQVHALMEV